MSTYGNLTIDPSYMNPPLMAVGDSLYQGVRSLAIKTEVMRFSAPALVARALGLDEDEFATPDPLLPLLVDMEKWLRLIPDMAKIDADLAANAAYWLVTPTTPSRRQHFDNIAVASMDISDLYAFDWEKMDQVVAKVPPGSIKSLGDLVKLADSGVALGDLVLALNARFTLNPMNDPRYRHVQPLALVAARKPKRLLVNIGSNNGLYQVGFEGVPVFDDRKVKEILGLISTLAQHLAALPKEVERIYVNTLALPSSVPCLMPLPDRLSVDWHPPGPTGYFDSYENRFGFVYGSMDGSRLKQQDEAVRQINAKLAEILHAVVGPRARAVDMAALLLRFDTKQHARTNDNVVRIDGKTFTNLMLEADPGFLGGGFARGGLFGLDGMHPTLLGYGLMARQVLAAMAQAEGLSAPTIPLEPLYQADTLLRDVPSIWSIALWLWRDYRRNQSMALTSRQREQARQVLDAVTRVKPYR